MFNDESYVKIQAYQGNETVGGQTEFAIPANKKLLSKLRPDFTSQFIKDVNNILEPLDTVSFSHKLPKKHIYQIGIFKVGHTKDDPAVVVAEVEIVTKVHFKLMKIADKVINPADEQKLPTLILRLKSSSFKFKEYFPKHIGQYCYLQINEEPKLDFGK